VAIYRYVTEGSFDAFMWQALETKARFIAQIMTGESAVRRAEDVGGQELSYAEVKAIASGNPAVLTLAETDAELQRLAVLRKSHTDEQYLARRNIRELPGRIDRLTQRLAGLSADQTTLLAHEEDGLTIGTRSLGRKEAELVLGERLEALPQAVLQDRRVPLGTYRGLRFGLVLHPQWRPEVYLEGAVTRQDMLAREHQGPRAVLNAVERLAGGHAGEIRHARRTSSWRRSSWATTRRGRPGLPARRVHGAADRAARPAPRRAVSQHPAGRPAHGRRAGRADQGAARRQQRRGRAGADGQAAGVGGGTGDGADSAEGGGGTWR